MSMSGFVNDHRTDILLMKEFQHFTMHSSTTIKTKKSRLNLQQKSPVRTGLHRQGLVFSEKENHEEPCTVKITFVSKIVPLPVIKGKRPNHIALIALSSTLTNCLSFCEINILHGRMSSYTSVSCKHFTPASLMSWNYFIFFRRHEPTLEQICLYLHCGWPYIFRDLDATGQKAIR